MVSDLTTDSGADALVRTALDRWGRVDVLVNNAGMTSVASGWDADGDVSALSLAQWDATIARNLTTAFLMPGRGSGDDLGRLRPDRDSRVDDGNGQRDARPVRIHRRQAALSDSPGALAPGGRRQGVTVNVVAPGMFRPVRSWSSKRLQPGPIGRSGTPEEIAACVAFLAHESASFVTGAVLVADGGHSLPETWLTWAR